MRVRCVARCRTLCACSQTRWANSALNLAVVLLGASGDLAHKKTVPALFHLFCDDGDALASFSLLGAARTALTSDTWRHKLRAHLPPGSNESDVNAFLERCSYVRLASYDGDGGKEGYKAIAGALDAHERAAGSHICGRLFYLATPPDVFAPAAVACRTHLTHGCDDEPRSWPEGDATLIPRRAGPGHAAAAARTTRRWARVVVEKPFGHDEASAVELDAVLRAHFAEHQIFRIDHFLGKELVSNILAMRFANALWEPVLNRDHVACVVITFKEAHGVENRGAFFDAAGILRDIVQNHLLQMACLIAMERPVSLCADDVRDEKVKALRAFMPPTPSDCVLGQYEGYRDTAGVRPGSRTPTFATVVLRSSSPRWAGVPFILRAGKGLNERKTEIRVQLQPPPGALTSPWPPLAGPQPTSAGRDELVIRVQPKEAIYLKLSVKAPGGSSQARRQRGCSGGAGAAACGSGGGELQSCHSIPTTMAELDLDYGARYEGLRIPDAYQLLLADCILHGDRSSYVRSDFVRFAWRLFDPLLAATEARDVAAPIPYAVGSRGPDEGDALVAREGYVRSTCYVWRNPRLSAASLL